MSFSVVLQAAGGNAIGVGHLSRTATLATALKNTGFWERVILLWETTLEIASLFQPPDCEMIVVSDSLAAIIERSHLCKQLDKAILVTDLLNVQVQDVVAAKHQGYRTFIHINDSGAGRFSSDMLVDEDAFKSLEDLPTSFQGIGLLGASYRIIRNSVAQIRPHKPWQKEKVEKLLITLGGADPGNLTLQLVRNLCDRQLPKYFSINIVIGPAFEPMQINQIQTTVAQNPSFRILKCPNSLGQLILENDLIVTLGGITAYEAMCIGKPCAAITWHSMAYYVEQLSAIGMLVNLRDVDSAIINLWAIINNVDFLHQIAKSGWQKIDGKGAERIANEIAKLAK